MTEEEFKSILETRGFTTNELISTLQGYNGATISNKAVPTEDGQDLEYKTVVLIETELYCIKWTRSGDLFGNYYKTINQPVKVGSIA